MTSVWSTESSSKMAPGVSWNPAIGGAAIGSGTNKVADVRPSLKPTQFPLGFNFAAFNLEENIW